MKTAESIKKEILTLPERGIPGHSFFHVKFTDDSEITEHETNWSDISEEQYVDAGGNPRIVRVAKHPIKSITVNHDGLSATIDLEDGEQAYQAITMIAIFGSNGTVSQRAVGRKVGKLKDGKIIEEKFVDGRTGEVIGFKY